MKIQSGYRLVCSNFMKGLEYTLCPHCEAYWYDDDMDAESDNPEFERYCQNCGKYFDYATKIDPLEEHVRARYKDLFTESQWELMTPTDIRCGFVDFVDSLNRDNQISDFMAENMDSWEGD